MATSVGIREAKVQLSRLIRKVKQGVEIVITDRGKPVGKIVPLHPSTRSFVERVKDLEMRGIIEEKESPSKALPPPIPVGGDMAQKYLQENRQ